MDKLFQKLKDSFSNYIKKTESIDRIHLAFKIAEKYHQGQKEDLEIHTSPIL